MDFSNYKLDKPSVMAMPLSQDNILGFSKMREASFPWPQPETYKPSKVLLAAWHLAGPLSAKFDQDHEANNLVSWQHCYDIDEIVNVLSVSEVALVVVDVGLSEYWPMNEVDRILAAAPVGANLVFVCSGSEADGQALEMRCRNVSNTHVIMSNRITSFELFEFCNIITKMRAAKPNIQVS